MKAQGCRSVGMSRVKTCRESGLKAGIRCPWLGVEGAALARMGAIPVPETAFPPVTVSRPQKQRPGRFFPSRNDHGRLVSRNGAR
jgi:hypothetical protein